MSRYFSPGSREQLVQEIHQELRGLHDAVDLVNQTVADWLGINRTDLRCISILQSRGPMTAGQLAEASGLTTGAMTTVLDRLEQAGYARRVRDATDRRRVLVEVTPLTLQRVGSLYADLVAATDVDLAEYSIEELLLIRDFVRRGREITQAHAAKLRAQDPAAPA